jgi:hypothetical protein
MPARQPNRERQAASHKCDAERAAGFPPSRPPGSSSRGTVAAEPRLFAILHGLGLCHGEDVATADSARPFAPVLTATPEPRDGGCASAPLRQISRLSKVPHREQQRAQRCAIEREAAWSGYVVPSVIFGHTGAEPVVRSTPAWSRGEFDRSTGTSRHALTIIGALVRSARSAWPERPTSRLRS